MIGLCQLQLVVISYVKTGVSARSPLSFPPILRPIIAYLLAVVVAARAVFTLRGCGGGIVRRGNKVRRSFEDERKSEGDMLLSGCGILPEADHRGRGKQSCKRERSTGLPTMDSTLYRAWCKTLLTITFPLSTCSCPTDIRVI